MNLRKKLLAKTDTPPDIVIYRDGGEYLRRWYIIPRNRWFNIYLHDFRQSDDRVAKHTHPWLFNISWLLRGCYMEHMLKKDKTRVFGDIKFRWGASPHWIELLSFEPGKCYPCVTLFITGPIVREWGFLCPTQGFRPHTKVTERVGNEVRPKEGACV